VFEGHRLPLTGVDQTNVAGSVVERSRLSVFFCVFPVFSISVMAKCCDACGDG
jgi:hypothetical protein